MEKFTYYPEDIVEVLSGLVEISAEDMPELEDALGDLMACAENPYNRNSFRVFYSVLEKLVEVNA